MMRRLKFKPKHVHVSFTPAEADAMRAALVDVLPTTMAHYWTSSDNRRALGRAEAKLAEAIRHYQSKEHKR